MWQGRHDCRKENAMIGDAVIESICGDCGEVFMAVVILGLTDCPKCGSTNTYVAITKPEKTEAK
jgi:Zn finger protein HypA/HybF involved in hydrogenase expression